MKVVHYWPHLFWLEASGPANSVLGWIRAQMRLGIEAAAVVDDQAIRVKPPEDIQFTCVKHVGRGHARIPLRLPISAKEGCLLITHGGWTLTNIVAGWHARRQGVPYIVMPHNVYDPEVLLRRRRLKRLWFAVLERPYLNKAAAIHVYFPEETQHLDALHVSSPLVIAPNGCTTREGVRWDGGSGGHLFWLGRYDPMNKGLDLLLQGLSLLPPSTRPQLLLHGRDYQGGKQVVDGLCTDLDLQASVTIGDPITEEEKWRLMATAKGFVYPSRWEGSSIAVAEAISLGTPTMVAGYPLGRFLASRGAVVLVDLTPQGIRDGIERLLTDEGRERGARGREVARDELSWDALARSWREQVERVLADAKR